MFKKHIQKGTGYSRLFIEKEITPLPRPVSCAEHAEHRPPPPPGAPRHALRGNPRVQHAAACGEAQTSGFGGRVCLQTQVRRGETGKTSPSLTRKRLVAAPVLNLFFFFLILFVRSLYFFMKGVAGTSVELRLHHNQSSGTLEGFPQGNRQTGGEEPLPSAGVGGPTSPACLSLAVRSLTQCDAHGSSVRLVGKGTHLHLLQKSCPY